MNDDLKEHGCINLTFMEYHLFIAHNMDKEASKKIDILNQNNKVCYLFYQYASIATNHYISSLVLAGLINEALSFLNSNSYIDNQKYIEKHKLLIEILHSNIENEDVEDLSINDADISNIVDFSTNAELAEFLANQKQKNIHAYYQTLNKESERDRGSSFENTPGESESILWSISETESYKVSAQSKFIFQGKVCYALIDPNIKLDPATLDQFNQAIDKGIAARSKGQNGIKFLKSILELKIDADLRLYTDIIYKSNHNGEYLIIFNKKADHTKIKQVIKSLEIGRASCRERV